MGEFIDKVKGNTNEAIGDAKSAIGRSTDNERLVEEGKAQHMKGDMQEKAGDVKGAMGDDI